MPLAPGRFSTSTGWPSRAVIFGPNRRAMMSVVLPGGNGTMILIGFEGQDCASAAAVNPRANAASTTTRSCLILALPIRFRQSVILRAAIAAVIPAQAGIQRPEVPGSPTKTKPGTSGKWPCHSYDDTPATYSYAQLRFRGWRHPARKRALAPSNAYPYT